MKIPISLTGSTGGVFRISPLFSRHWRAVRSDRHVPYTDVRPSTRRILLSIAFFTRTLLGSDDRVETTLRRTQDAREYNIPDGLVPFVCDDIAPQKKKWDFRPERARETASRRDEKWDASALAR